MFLGCRLTTVPVLFVLLASLAPTSTLAEAEPLVVGDTFRLRSEVLDEERVINVYRPPGAEEGEPLPVLYMPDGGIGEDFLHIAGLVQISALNGTMRPFLLVGIENTERRRDLTGLTKVDGERRVAPRVGGSADFRRFLRQELMPEIEGRYATTGERALVGESLAGDRGCYLEVLRPWVPTHCQEGETIVFSCGVSEQRVVSLCASADLAADTGTLQYRFGPYGEAPSTVFPDPAAHPAEHFRSGTLMFSGGGGAYLKFAHQGTTSVVFTAIGKGWQKEALQMEAPGEPTVVLPCLSEWRSEIGPELFEDAGIPADPEGFELPMD